jgi:hypothetical protein
MVIPGAYVDEGVQYTMYGLSHDEMWVELIDTRRRNRLIGKLNEISHRCQYNFDEAADGIIG